MLRIPRGLSGRELAKLLTKHGYAVTRQTESHIRLSSTHRGPEHKITIPDHSPIKLGTLNSILADIANYLRLSKNELMDDLFR